MSKYKFPLEKLLSIRKDKEEESKRQFREAQLSKENVEKKLQSIKDTYSKYNVLNKNETLLERKVKGIYLESLKLNIKELCVELDSKKKILEEKRLDLKEKQIDRKTVETLKEKKETTFYKEMDRIEQLNNDEFALYAFMRKLEGR